MPPSRCPNGKWRIGNGPCIYKTKEAAVAAYRGYRARQAGKVRKRR